MSTRLSSYFEEARLSRNLKPSQLAKLAGYQKILRVGGKIRTFELTGKVSQFLFEKLVATLDLDHGTIARLIEEDRRESYEEWLAWVNEAVEPEFVVLVIAGVCIRKPIPAEVTTLEEAEVWGAGVAKAEGRRCCLVWSRKLSVWFSKNGSSFRTEANQPKPNYPWVQIGNKNFTFGVGPDSIVPVPRPKKLDA